MFRSLRAEGIKLGWLAVLTICISGCQPAGTSPEEEHKSHEHFPPHWPHTIFNASDRLTQLIEQPAGPSTGERIAPHLEFMDLIGWLPILAADSDLDRATFDRIDATSTKIQSRWSKSLPQDLESLVKDPEARDMIAWLADVCRQEQSRTQQQFASP